MALVKPTKKGSNTDDVQTEVEDIAAEEQNDTEQQEEVQVSESKEVQATDASDKQVATTNNPTAGVTAMLGGLAEEGYEGLEVGGFSFDRLKLHEGTFKLGDEEVDLGQEIQFILMSTRPIYAVRQSEDSDAEMFYSYDKDGKTHTDGTSAQNKLDEWIEDGYDRPSVRKYLEGMAILKNRDDEYDEAVVSLSIPPTSIQKLGGVLTIAKMKSGKPMSEVTIKAKVGKKVGSGNTAFRPWVFSQAS